MRLAGQKGARGQAGTPADPSFGGLHSPTLVERIKELLDESTFNEIKGFIGEIFDDAVPGWSKLYEECAESYPVLDWLELRTDSPARLEPIPFCRQTGVRTIQARQRVWRRSARVMVISARCDSTCNKSSASCQKNSLSTIDAAVLRTRSPIIAGNWSAAICICDASAHPDSPDDSGSSDWERSSQAHRATQPSGSHSQATTRRGTRELQRSRRNLQLSLVRARRCSVAGHSVLRAASHRAIKDRVGYAVPSRRRLHRIGVSRLVLPTK